MIYININTVQAAVVGLGNIGSVHAKSIFNNKIDCMQLVAVCDSSPERLAWAEEEMPTVKRFASYEKMLESGIDAVIIATPHYLHPPMAMEAFKRNIHVLSEKPAGVYAAQVKEMNKETNKAGVVFSVMFNQRTSPIFSTMRQMIQNGEVGIPTRLNWLITNWYRTQEYYESSSWRATWRGEGGGVLINQAVHNLDLWQWIFGAPQKMTAFCGFGKFHDIEVEDEASLFAEYDDGRSAVFIATTGDYPGTNRLEITGTGGKLVAENNTLVFYKSNAEKSDFDIISIDVAGEKEGHMAIIQNFANAIRWGEKLISPGEEGVISVEMLNAAYYSAWQNGSQTLPVPSDDYYKLLESKFESMNKQGSCKVSDNGEGYLEKWNVNW
ncbi:Gfo/Idh/MocA family protein [Scatolibacter rhodanostii]|uniref:Gfo/Idh/MocA family protein n=1 Tax=Scatolibacter rhodanostii TaxID=2014781 RepID=UPI000C087B88|nr:Gfo/Idh/MocA family oxidoreductase [Scatolibacter rhodanostii]